VGSVTFEANIQKKEPTMFIKAIAFVSLFAVVSGCRSNHSGEACSKQPSPAAKPADAASTTPAAQGAPAATNAADKSPAPVAADVKKTEGQKAAAPKDASKTTSKTAEETKKPEVKKIEAKAASGKSSKAK
jgi:Flp pilus assembly protein TadD